MVSNFILSHVTQSSQDLEVEPNQTNANNKSRKCFEFGLTSLYPILYKSAREPKNKTKSDLFP